MTTSTYDIIGRDALGRLAEGYKKAADAIDNIPDYEVHAFRKLIQLQFADLSKIIYFDFVNHYPYEYKEVVEMIYDFRKGVIQVNTSGNDSKLWGKVYNLQFRAIHDYIHCLHNLDFNFPNEVRAFNQQLAFSKGSRYALKFPYLNWERYEAVLRSEIIYQAAIKEHFKVFDLDTQKIVLREL